MLVFNPQSHSRPAIVRLDGGFADDVDGAIGIWIIRGLALELLGLELRLEPGDFHGELLEFSHN